MGGSVAVTVREENGQEHRMCRWTNSMPWFVNNIRLVNKDKQHLQKYLQTWRDFEEDYAKHKDEYERLLKEHDRDIFKFKDLFELNMTPCYAPYPFLAPHSYGLLVVDMKNNLILDYQDYATFGKIYGVSVKNDMAENYDGTHTLINIGGVEKPQRGMNVFDLDDDAYDAVRLKEFLDAGKVLTASFIEVLYDYMGKSPQEVEKLISEKRKENPYFDPISLRRRLKLSDEIDMQGKTLETALGLISTYELLYFNLDITPFEIVKSRPHDPQKAKELRQKIKDLDFKLSDEEEKIWEDWIANEEEWIAECSQ